MHLPISDDRFQGNPGHDKSHLGKPTETVSRSFPGDHRSCSVRLEDRVALLVYSLGIAIVAGRLAVVELPGDRQAGELEADVCRGSMYVGRAAVCGSVSEDALGELRIVEKSIGRADQEARGLLSLEVRLCVVEGAERHCLQAGHVEHAEVRGFMAVTALSAKDARVVSEHIQAEEILGPEVKANIAIQVELEVGRGPVHELKLCVGYDATPVEGHPVLPHLEGEVAQVVEGEIPVEDRAPGRRAVLELHVLRRESKLNVVLVVLAPLITRKNEPGAANGKGLLPLVGRSHRALLRGPAAACDCVEQLPEQFHLKLEIAVSAANLEPLASNHIDRRTRWLWFPRL